MDETITANLSEILELLVATLGVGLLSTVGVYLESLAVEAFAGGEVQVAAWLFVAGLVALYFGVYALGISTVIPRFRRLRRSLARR